VDLAVADCTIVDAAGERVVEPGAFEVRVGRSSKAEDLLRASFEVV
jgi:beta-glucosidase